MKHSRPVGDAEHYRSAADRPSDSTRRLYIAWKSACFRSTQSADLFSARIAFIAPLGRGGSAKTVLRYIASFALTILVLARERPHLLIMLNQPAPLALAALLYSFLPGRRIILDCHSKVYEPAMQRSPLGAINRAVTRRAALNINHNEEDSAVVKRWGGVSAVLPVLPFRIPVAMRPEVRDHTLTTIVCSFAADEPIDSILDACRLCPELKFAVTGNFAKVGLAREDFPPNVEATGFLSERAYYQLLSRSAVIATFSDRSNIMQMAVEEAVTMGRPVVSNLSPTLHNVLGDAGVLVPIDAQSMADGFRRAVREAPHLEVRMRSVRAHSASAALTLLKHQLAGLGVPDDLAPTLRELGADPDDAGLSVSPTASDAP